MSAAPIFVIGVPRSGTSLTAGILAACGAFTGQTFGPSEWNKKGSFENRALKENMVKPWLTMIGADPLGLSPLPSDNDMEQVLVNPDRWALLAEGYLHRQGWDSESPWLFKDCKMVLQYQQWRQAFPTARWISVRRDPKDIIESCMRAEPMLRRMGPDWKAWADWVDEYTRRLMMVPVNYEIWPDRDILTATAGIESVVRKLGLTWRPDTVAKFIDMDLWGG